MKKLELMTNFEHEIIIKIYWNGKLWTIL